MPQDSCNYYSQNLNSQKLYQVYDTKIPRVKRYLDEEISFVRGQLIGCERVLEIGAGYGRILKELAPYASLFVGIDISEMSIKLGRELLHEYPHVALEVIDAHELDLEEEFDVVLCLQNGLSAMNGEAANLVRRSLNSLRKGGKAYFSTYSNKFWEHRIAWFMEQADKGLLGKIDEEQTKNGVIICEGGFKAVTFTEEDFVRLGKLSGYRYEIREVDESSLFLVITKTKN